MKLSEDYGKCGIYKITNTINFKGYIGSSNNLGKRISGHYKGLLRNEHPNRYLQHSWNKYGEGAFAVNVVEYCEEADLLVREQYWIDYYEVTNESKGYNLCPTAYSQLGRKQSKEEIEKRAAKLRGRKFPPEFGQAVSIRMKGRTVKEETKAKRRRPVLQLTTDNTFVKEWPSIGDAATSLGVGRSAISMCLSGKNKTCQGYKWKLKHDE